MLEIPTSSADEVLQDHFNSEVARAIEEMDTKFKAYKDSIEELYRVESLQGDTSQLGWSDFMRKLYNKVKTF